MVVKMMKWSPWPPPAVTAAAAARKFQVKVKEMKVEGFVHAEEREKVMVIEMRWKGSPKPGFIPFQRTPSKQHKHISGEAVLKSGEPVKWGDEFEHICNFPTAAKDGAFGPWDASFTIRCGSKAEAKAKLAVVGKASVNLAALASEMKAEMKAEMEMKLPVAGEATLSMCIGFVEVRDCQGLPGTVEDSTESKNVEDERDGSEGNKNEGGKRQEEVSLNDLDGSVGFDSDIDTSSRKNGGLFYWKRRRLSFKPGKTQVEPLTKKTGDGVDGPQICCSSVDSINSNSSFSLKLAEAGNWEERELVSRDGEAKLKANVFFASFDQCSDKAAGESACTALVAVIAHWLHSNPHRMPTRSEFDSLIKDGSSEWRKLCNNQALITRFHDKHFDLETLVEAGIRPLSVSHDKSFIGFFGPNKFESLKEAMSFDQIWDRIKCNKPSIYIVSWNDHFFVLKVDFDAFYIIDTLGERLFEGCSQAFILRFDDSASMKGKVEKGKVEPEGEGETAKDKEEEICKGKECCREYIKRFLAAIPLGELELEEKKGPVPYFALHQRLQIEFNFSSFLSSHS